MILLAVVLSFRYNEKGTKAFIMNTPKVNDVSTIITSLNAGEIEMVKAKITETDNAVFVKQGNDLEAYLNNVEEGKYEELISL